MIVVKDLTRGERLWVWMRRFRYTNEDVAMMLGVGSKIVTDMLHDRPLPRGVDGAERIVVLNHLHDREVIALARRRMDWTLREAAARFGISHVTLVRKEKGRTPVDDLMDWWEDWGWPPAADFICNDCPHSGLCASMGCCHQSHV